MKICYTIILLSCVLFAGSASAQSWQKSTKFPGGVRDGAVEFSIGSNIYFGTGGINDFWEFNTTTSTWTKKANLPSIGARAFASGFSIGDKGYIACGNTGSTPLKDVWEYDPAANTWTKKADYPAGGRDALLAFSINGKAYLGGGTDDSYLYKEFYEFDPVANTWTSLGTLPTGAIAFPSSFVIGSLAYVTGGDLGVFIINGDTVDVQSSQLNSFDPVSKQWTSLSDFPGAARQTAVAFTIGNTGYVGLGQSSYDTVYRDFYSYDPSQDQWNKVGVDFPVAPGRAWASATVAGGKAYVGGGWDFGANFFNDWWSFDPSATASVETEVPLDGITAFPNPVQSVFRLAGTGNSSSGDLRIFDMLGDQSMHVMQSPDGTYDVSLLPAGDYVVRTAGQQFSTAVKIHKN